MGTTPKLAIPYVEPTDTLANFPVADKAQADRVEAMITAPFRLARSSAWLVPAAGWSLETNQLDKYSNGYRQIMLTMTRTGAAITVPANGDIATQAIGTYATVGIGQYFPITSWFTGRMAQYAMGGTTFSLVACAPGSNIVTGEQLSALGMFIGGE